MLLLRQPAARSDVGMLLLLLLSLLALLLMLPPLDLISVGLPRVVCHDALLLNTTGGNIALKARRIMCGLIRSH
jgi:hypothetical protein